MTTEDARPNTPVAAQKLAAAEHPFKKIAFPNFKPALVANKLLHPKSKHRGLQEVLFAGFCAWVLAPHSSDLRAYAMRLTARRIYDEACDALLGERDSANRSHSQIPTLCNETSTAS